jgi:uncharacterized membrane protein YcfT
VFFVVTKLTRHVPPLAIFIGAAILESLRIKTGWIMIDEFAARFVYFFAGYWLAKNFFAFAEAVAQRPMLSLAAIPAWALANGLVVFAGYGDEPVISLVLGFAGASAIIAVAVLLAHANLIDLLRHAGEHSIAVYLAFFLPMAITRTILLKTGIVTDIGSVALIVTAAGVIGPLVLHWLVTGTRLDFLFKRPAYFYIDRPRHRLQPAE